MNKNIDLLFSLKGKVAVITGAVGQIGYQYAEILSDAGAHIVLVDIDQNKCDEFAEKITQRNGIKSIGIGVDISNEKSVEEMYNNILIKLGRIDILINNAAFRPKDFFSSAENYPVDSWDEVMNVNLKGMFICAKICSRQMMRQGSGVIVNISSTYGLVGPDPSIYGNSGINAPIVYTASKAGVIGLTKYLATHWGSKNIRVNCLTPGGVENSQDPEFIKKYCAKTPLNRMAKKDDYKGAMLFLVSDASKYMTGANLVVDGGWTAW